MKTGTAMAIDEFGIRYRTDGIQKQHWSITMSPKNLRTPEMEEDILLKYFQFYVIVTITLQLFTIGANLHIGNMCRNRGNGEWNPHQGCRVGKIH